MSVCALLAGREFSATDRSPVQRNPSDCSVSMCATQKPQEMGGPGLRWSVVPEEKNSKIEIK